MRLFYGSFGSQMGVIVIENDSVDVDLGGTGLDTLAHQVRGEAIRTMESNSGSLVDLRFDEGESI
jgi:hypothetical protein